MLKQTRFLMRDDLRLRAEHWVATPADAASAPLVVLVHGFPDTPHSWYGVATQLLAAGYQVLMPWLRGYTDGCSQRGGNHDLVRCADDLAAWCEELAQPRAHLVGHDWGAVLAQLAAQTQAAQWRSISLLAIPALFPLLHSPHALPALPKQLVLSRYMTHLQLAQSWRWVSADQAAWVEKTWRRWSPTWHFTDNDIMPARLVFSQPHLARAATRYYRALFTPWLASTRKLYVLMSRRINHPLLLLAGAEDGCMHADFHHRLAQGVILDSGVTKTVPTRPSPENHVLPGLGHFLQAENPSLIADYLLRFFATTDLAMSREF